MITDTEFIHPEDEVNLNYWQKKFNVNQRELADAILTTGSLNSKTVKEYLKRESWLYNPVDGTYRFLMATINHFLKKSDL